tara:strand:+ start:4502 stop:5923 length:1422 start_codon:yes stop_codon:yes gene_type:complete
MDRDLELLNYFKEMLVKNAVKASKTANKNAQGKYRRFINDIKQTRAEELFKRYTDEEVFSFLIGRKKTPKRFVGPIFSTTNPDKVPKSKVGDDLLAEAREWASQHVHHGAELDQFAEAIPDDARAQDYLSFDKTAKELGDSGIGSSGPRYPGGESDHYGYKAPGQKPGEISIDQLTSYHFEGTKGEEIKFMTQEGTDARTMETLHEKYRAQKRIESRFNDPNTVRNRLLAIKNEIKEPDAFWKDKAGIIKLDEKYPDKGILDLWQQGHTPGYNPRNRVATPEEIANPNIAALNAELRGDAPTSIKGKRKAANLLTKTGLAAGGFSILGAGSSLAETAIRLDVATETKDPADFLQFTLSGISGLADFLPIAGELLSTPADYGNKRMDIYRGFAEEDKPVSEGVKQAAEQTQMTGVSQGNTPMPMADAQQTLESLERLPGELLETGKQGLGALESLYQKAKDKLPSITLGGYSGF